MKWFIQADTKAKDDVGITIHNWGDVATVKSRYDVQPVSGEIVQQKYGISKTGITFRLFCEPNAALDEGLRITKDHTRYYSIEHVSKWPKHYELLLREVNP